MKNPWIRPLQLCIGAAVLGMAGLATAQPAPPADGAPPPPPAAEKAKPHHHKKHAEPKGTAKRGYDRRDPAQHEAAAAAEQARSKGGIQPGDHFQRNALARCDVFKNEADRHSCVDRVKDGQVSGSVEGGGVLREYTEQVPVMR